MREMEMEVDVGSASEASPSSSLKKLGLKNAIQTNFGEDYVFQIASSQDIPALAVSLSTNAIKLYSSESGQYFGECKGHSGRIHEISFSAPASPHVLCSCSSDGTVRAWDTRSFKQVSMLRAGPSQEIFSFSFGGSNGNLLAAGSDSQVLFWDWRNGKQVACLEESHMDDVTHVQFIPGQQNKLISSSVDGLLCLFDTDGDINDDSNLSSVMNVETSVSKVGFFGNDNQKLWCLTHIETLSIWDWNEGRREANFEQARSLVSDQWNLNNVDYFVDCHYSSTEDRLWLIGGTSSGTLGYFPITQKCNGTTIGAAEAILEGGHMGVVRSILPANADQTSSNLGKSRGIFGWTGGEDGRLCCWLSGESDTLGGNPSWISSSLVMKPKKSKNKARHHPY
ncbi:transducin/WD40 repeat-like superfamily protein isoform X1 [Carex rostrata]